METQEVQEFTPEITAQTRLPMITIFKDPVDAPGEYVARLFDLSDPTKYAAKGKTLEEVRKAVPWWMSRMAPAPQDHPSIVETWL